MIYLPLEITMTFLTKKDSCKFGIFFKGCTIHCFLTNNSFCLLCVSYFISKYGFDLVGFVHLWVQTKNHNIETQFSFCFWVAIVSKS